MAKRRTRRQKTLKLRVLGRLVSPNLKLMVEKLARDLIAELFSTRMANTLDITIELRKTTLEKSHSGICHTANNGSQSSRKFRIKLRSTRGLAEIGRTLAHELIHVEQFASKRLQLRPWKSDGRVHARWEGEELGVFADIPYATQPWEVEARTKSIELIDDYLKRAA